MDTSRASVELWSIGRVNSGGLPGANTIASPVVFAKLRMRLAPGNTWTINALILNRPVFGPRRNVTTKGKYNEQSTVQTRRLHPGRNHDRGGHHRIARGDSDSELR